MNHTSVSNFGIKVKAIREQLGLTQVALARVLGVSFPTVNRWENGKTKPSQLAWNKLLNLELEPRSENILNSEQSGGKEDELLGSLSLRVPSELPEQSGVMSKLIALRSRAKIPLTFTIKISLGDEKERPSDEIIQEFNRIFDWAKKYKHVK